MAGDAGFPSFCYNSRAVDVPGLLMVLAIGLAIGWAWLVAYTAWMLTHPPRRAYAWAVSRSLPGSPDELRRVGQRPESPAAKVEFESWTFRSRGRDLPVWEIHGDRRDGPVVVMSHGWGDSRTVLLASGRVEALLPQASRVVMWDMPGHGDAAGVCSLGEGEAEDLAELVSRLMRDDGENVPREVVFYGFSLGAAVTLQTYSKLKTAPKAVIVEAPYVAPDVPARNVLRLRGLPFAANLGPALWLSGVLQGRLRATRPLRAMTAAPFAWLMPRRIEAPTLILHGSADAITPIDGARAIAAALPFATLVEVPGARHTTMWTEASTRQIASEAVSKFLESRTDQGAE